MSTNSEDRGRAMKLRSAYNRAYDKDQRATYTVRHMTGLEAVAAAAWQAGWNQGFRDYQAAVTDDDGYLVITPTKNPHENALVVPPQDEN